MEKTKCYSYFCIESAGEILDMVGFVADDNSFFEPDKITEILGIEPFKTKLMGSQRKNGKGVFPFSNWCACKTTEPILDAEEQCLNIVRKLKPLIPKLNEIKRMYNVNFDIMIVPYVYNEESPILCFTNEIIEFCYLTKTEIIVDMYVFDKE